MTGLLLAAIAAQAIVVIHPEDVKREEPPPHGAIGMSTAYRYSDAAPEPRAMEFRVRTLHKGAAIGLHSIDHDEVYYVLDGEGELTGDGVAERVKPRMAAYIYKGARVGIRQVGKKPLMIVISYPK